MDNFSPGQAVEVVVLEDKIEAEEDILGHNIHRNLFYKLNVATNKLIKRR